MKNKYLLILIIFIICSFLLTGCKSDKESKTSQNIIKLTAEQEKNINLELAKAEYNDLALAISIPAQFKAVTFLTSRLYAPVDGKVKKVFVEPGQTVKKGEPLVIIQSDTIGQIESELLQNIIQISAQIRMSQAQLEFARNNYKRESVLLSEKVTSKKSWEESKTQMYKEMANLSALGAQRSSLISVYQQRLNLYGADSSVINRVISTNKIYPFITIKSQLNGIVMKRDINEEEFVQLNKEMFEVSDLNKIWLVGYLFEKDINSVKVSNKVTATINDTEKVTGEVTYISPNLDNNTKTMEVRAEIDNKTLNLKPNMFADMLINTGVKNALIIPKSAIQKLGDSNLVYVKISPHTYEERKIETGTGNDKQVEIISGVKEGEFVVTNGSFSLLGESIKKDERE